MRRPFAFLLVLLLVPSVCVAEQRTTTAPRPKAPAAPVTVPGGEIDPPAAAVEKRLKELEDLIKNHWTWINRLMGLGPNALAFVDCSTGNYQEAIPSQGSHLVFLIKCDKIEPYLEGFRATIAVGNPYYASFTGLKGQLGYGETPNDTRTQVVPFSSVERVAAGSWTRVQVAITPAQAKDVRNITIDFTVDTAALSR